MKPKPPRRTGLVVLWTIAVLSGHALADATGLLVGKLADGSKYDRLWSSARLYKNDDNPVVQEVAIQGQFALQYAAGTRDFGSYYLPKENRWDNIDVRRLRLGIDARVYRHFRVHYMADLFPELAPRIFNRTMEAYLCYAPRDPFNVTVGKMEVKFSREQEVTAKEILTFERSLMEGMLYAGQLTGVRVSGSHVAGGGMYEIGVYANDRPDDFSGFGGGAVILTKIGWDFTKSTQLDHCQMELHFMHNTEPGFRDALTDPASPNFSNSFALSNDITEGRFSLATEAYWADGANGQSDVWGLTVTPAWYLLENLQAVAMFQYARSVEANGLGLPPRYEAFAAGPGDKRGDAYFSTYAGLNYYLYGHKLKFMAGVKYAHLRGGPGGGDFDGFTGLTGVRGYF